jgi:hypothetical protein
MSMLAGEIMRQIHVMLPFAIEVIVVAIVMAVVGISVKMSTDRKWNYNLKHFLPEVTRRQIAERDQKIHLLSEEVERLREENEAMQASIRGALLMNSKVTEVLTTTTYRNAPEIPEPRLPAERVLRVAGKHNGTHLR